MHYLTISFTSAKSEASHLTNSGNSKKVSMERRKSTALPLNKFEKDSERSNSDEFLDEDLDDRAEDIADEISTQVHIFRLMRYIFHVLSVRLLLTGATSSETEERKKRGGCNYSELDFTTIVIIIIAHFNRENLTAIAVSLASSRDNEELLPVPLAGSRIPEVLGAVTMVCFVDDDIVCESFSVTEEIYLMMDNNQDGSANSEVQGSAAIQSTTENKEDNFRGFRPETDDNFTARKGKVLDLHANPNKTGSRFEHPLWWRYLPNLKPIGLDALFTYMFTSSTYGDSINNDLRQPEAKSSQGHIRSAAGVANVHTTSAERRNISQLQTQTSSNYSILAEDPKAELNAGDIQRSLVRHIRRIIPLESLRELSEEIGFTESDLKAFSPLLEINVLAPGLEKAHLLEDAHHWGQEESRRRGTLTPQLRGSIVRDERGGALQMMSIGDPSLILHYCKEYWDGSSMTPLSASDRNIVLQVYERWKLEDFDVVAFSYSPVPVLALTALDPVASALGRRTFSRADASFPTTNPFFSVSTLVFVDPFTIPDKINLKSRVQIKVGESEPEVTNIPFRYDEKEDEQTGREKYDDILAESGQAVQNRVSITVPSTICEELIFTERTDTPTLDVLEETRDGRESITLRKSASESNLKTLKERTLLSNYGSRDGDSFTGALDKLVEPNSELALRQIAGRSSDLSFTLPHEDILSPPEEDLVYLDVEMEAGVPMDSNHDSQSRNSEDSIMDGEILKSYSGLSIINTEARQKLCSASDDNIASKILNRRRSVSDVDKRERTYTASSSELAMESPFAHESDEDKAYRQDTSRYSNSNLPVAGNFGFEKVAEMKQQANRDDYDLRRSAVEDAKIDSTKGSRYDKLAQRAEKHKKSSKPHSHYSANRQRRRANLKQVWSLLRQQVFLGMAASSVPVRSDVPNTKEDLTAAGVRFVYFSPRNMKRSKPVAEKIGISFDWNCAISLRDLDEAQKHDPHRHISSYADWDVLGTKIF